MRTHLAPVALAVLCLSGCGDREPFAPTVNLDVEVATTGLDEDPDGYFARVGEHVRTPIPATGVWVERYSLEPGTYDVSLEGLARTAPLRGRPAQASTLWPGTPPWWPSPSSAGP